MQLMTAGTSIASADVSVNTRGASPYEFYHVHLEDVLVGSYQIEPSYQGGAGSSLLEEFTLLFRKATFTYTPHTSNGTSGTPVQSVIDTTLIGATVLPFQPTQGSLLQSSTPPFSGSEFLRLDGIDGESKAAGHVAQIVLDAFAFRSFFNHGSGKANYSSLHLVAPYSIASPKLMEYTASGQTIPTADLTVVSSGGLDVYDIHLTDAIVSSYQLTSTRASSDGLTREEFTLSFATIQIMYHYQTAGGLPQTVQFVDNATAVLADSLPPAASLLDSFFPPPTQSMYVRLDGVTGGTVVNGQPNEVSALAFSWAELGASISNLDFCNL